MTTYTLHTDGAPTDFARATKSTVIAEAKARLAARTAHTVSITTAAGNVVFEAAARRVTRPYTLVTPLPADLQALVPAGYVAAYKRLRNGAVVLRREMDIEEDDSRYAVLDTTAHTLAGYADTTRAAGRIMKALGLARRAALATTTTA